MALIAGSNLGPYVVVERLGKGGMGEVWRARDARLGRDVAIKALPPEFEMDPERLGRFEREAKVLAVLNHANIAALYGLEQAHAQTFLVLELVDGQTLAERLAAGALPVPEALHVAVQIAEAIEAAHEKDIIHRDLKPANIKLTSDGDVKVLDFGLAKAFEGNGTEPNVFNSPTLSLAATAQGVILGTAAYMSPEQARGQVVDRRTDIWAFGCVLYELLTARPAFRGELVSDILASVLAREPEYSELPASLPPRLRDALRRCLEKNPKRRWQAMGDLRVELEQILADPVVDPTPAAATRLNRTALALAIIASAVIAASAAWLLKPAPRPTPKEVVRFFSPVNFSQLRATGRPMVALSPDGRYFAYNTSTGVFLRAMDTLTARPIPGTDTPLTGIFFSPNGEWLAYWSTALNALQKVSVGGGAPVTLGPAANPLGASWGNDGNILFAETDGIWRVSAEGGKPELVIKTDPGFPASPSLLPDGKTILYTFTTGTGADRWDQAEIIAQQPGGKPKVVVRGGSDATYVETGHLVYAVGNALYAVPFDPNALQTNGGAVPVVTGVERAAAVTTPSANYGIARNGTLAYLNAVTTTAAVEDTLDVVNRTGAVKALDVPKAMYRNPRVSPNGRSIAVETVTATGQSVIWVYDLAGGAAIRRLTQEGNNTRPVWSADGKRIAYGSDREKPQGIFWQLADGSGLPERLTSADEGYEHYPESFSPDGKVLSFARVKPPLGQDAWGLWTLRLDGPDRKPVVFFDLPSSNEFGSSFSPDGKWIAYASNASPDAGGAPTSFAIYMQPYPPTGVKYQISQNGGAWPLWTSGGRELLYRVNVTAGAEPRLNVVSITTAPVPAFTAERALSIQGFQPVVNNREYDVFPGGRDLLMVLPETRRENGAPPPAEIRTVLNFTEELKARVPTTQR
ncbi:MAG TPA: protein kinase [Vicinamibacterales bacterium]|nr:protein kinase [Vicinamibacterales bacterium]